MSINQEIIRPIPCELQSPTLGLGDLALVIDTTVEPYHWVCQLLIQYGDRTLRGTGFLLSIAGGTKTLIVTAAHCVYSRALDRPPDQITINQARNGFTYPSEPIVVTDQAAFKYPPEWTAFQLQFTYDYGAIVLDLAPTGLGYEIVDECSTLQRNTWTMAGYPIAALDGTMWSQNDAQITRCGNQLALTNFMASEGFSGAPVLRYDGMSWYAAGIIFGNNDAGTLFNRFYPDMWSNLQSWAGVSA